MQERKIMANKESWENINAIELASMDIETSEPAKIIQFPMDFTISNFFQLFISKEC